MDEIDHRLFKIEVEDEFPFLDRDAQETITALQVRLKHWAETAEQLRSKPDLSTLDDNELIERLEMAASYLGHVEGHPGLAGLITHTVKVLRACIEGFDHCVAEKVAMREASTRFPAILDSDVAEAATELKLPRPENELWPDFIRAVRTRAEKRMTHQHEEEK